MELNQFIKEAVLEAVKGIEEARKENKNFNAGINERYETDTMGIEITAFFGTDGDKLIPVYGEESSKIKITVPVKFDFRE